jgi:bifunctional non-homologous end joining protein LigD
MSFTPIKPMLVSMGKEAFDDNDYIFEGKMDGWRVLLYKEGNRIEAYTRNGNRISDKFPELVAAAQQIQSHAAILDCEGVCFRDNRSIFDDFSYRCRLSNPLKITRAQHTHPATFVAFDLLATDTPHMNEPLMTRKMRLQELVTPSDVLIPIPYVEGRGKALQRFTVENNWEGTVAKYKHSRWIAGTRSPEWIKIKNWKTIDTVILGYREKPRFGLIVGLHFPTIRNKAVAIVEAGISPDEKIAFKTIAKQIKTHKERDTQWIEPLLSCKIQYLERTDRHHLRITSFKGFLFDKKPEDCKWFA